MEPVRSEPPRWALPGILAVFILLGLLYIWQVPPFEGPDEGEHFAYITWLAERGTFPPQGAAAWETPVRQEAGQPPLYYLLASLPARLIDLDDPPAPYRINPYAFSLLGSTDNRDNDNRALHYPGDASPLRGGWLALYAARGISLAAGVLLVASVFGLARQVVPEQPAAALLAAAFVALLPQVLFVSSVASNDMLAAALSTLAFWLLARLLRHGPAPGRGAALGLVFGLAVLTKVSTALLALPVAAALVWLLARDRSLQTVAKTAISIMLASVAVSGWWFLRAWTLYGTPLGLEAHDFTSWAIGEGDQVAVWYARWAEVFRSFWGAFGWGTIRPPEAVYMGLALLAILSLLGLGRTLLRWWGRGRPLTVTAVLGLLLVLLLAGNILFLELWMHRVVADHGRLLFPALGSISLGLVTGWRALHARLTVIALSGLASLAVLSPLAIIRPAFQPPSLLSPEEIKALPSGPLAHFALEGEEPVAELLWAQPLLRTAQAAGRLPVQLCWRALRAASANYTVLVHLVGPADRVVGQRRSYPGLGDYPTEIWQPGAAFCDHIEIDIDEQLAQTLVYKIEVGLLDETTDRRLRAFSLSGQPLGIVLVGDVLLVAKAPAHEPVPDNGQPLHLLDYQLSDHWQPGMTASFTLRWGVAQPIRSDYQLFVHLREPETDLPVAQADGPPLDGWYPTPWWTKGDVIVDERLFPLPADMRQGTYRLVVGFYDLATKVPFGPSFDLGLVEVRP